ncbi:MAG: protease inhibitor I42 family protein [Bacteroidetes bacterium]|nr:protease inhibitor I42 family protein [Bacteroidota bacterium]MBS1974479.1 protease inhibitor I42 family protein [Bacteroidota bacterium]
MDAQELQIKSGASILIKLESRTTSGYQWGFEIDDGFIARIEKADKEFRGELKPGDSGREVFLVTGLKKGTAKIVFKQQRIWQKKDAPLRSMYYTIIVS